eukprot:TRINITY_DN3668_c0_g1_i1.p1 TRINITY_DN3668_c0_g1~~TRINITY_DN3668_c0_g1_i1.p1  ORF type:complete len:391 (-),score=85.33 TRINITY_DN3668_c0_g1_i1:17-1189(-)
MRLSLLNSLSIHHTTSKQIKKNATFKRDHHFWLRAECKPLERRTILMPKHVDTLIQNGHTVTVEKSGQRSVPIEEYEQVKGVHIAEEGTWINAPQDAIIMGLKELPEAPDTLTHSHIYFAHCFKDQYGHEVILKRFVDGKGKLYDLEFLEQNKRRIAAFGQAAGSAGTAVGVLDYIWIKSHPNGTEPLPSITHLSFDTSKDFADYVRGEAEKNGVPLPSAHIIGALGQVGTGARKMLDLLGVPDEKIQLWDMQETANATAPYEILLESDIFINCINLREKGLVFLDEKTINKERKLSVVSDISCDYTNPANPLPIYNKGTSFKNPAHRIVSGENPLDVVAIDYLPTLIPRESSEQFGDKLLPHLLQFDNTSVWQNALDLFYQKSSVVSKN